MVDVNHLFAQKDGFVNHLNNHSIQLMIYNLEFLRFEKLYFQFLRWEQINKPVFIF